MPVFRRVTREIFREAAAALKVMAAEDAADEYCLPRVEGKTSVSRCNRLFDALSRANGSDEHVVRAQLKTERRFSHDSGDKTRARCCETSANGK